MNFFRGALAFGVALLGVVGAQAQSIILDSYGAWGGRSGSDSWTQNETAIYPPSNMGGLPDLTMLVANVTTNGSYDALTGVATYSDTTGDELILDWTVTNNTYGGGGAFSMDGTWTYAGGTGAYASSHITSGSGTFAVSQNNAESSQGFSGTVLTGDLIAAPEPASLAFLGLGVVGALARRRKHV